LGLKTRSQSAAFTGPEEQVLLSVGGVREAIFVGLLRKARLAGDRHALVVVAACHCPPEDRAEWAETVARHPIDHSVQGVVNSLDAENWIVSWRWRDDDAVGPQYLKWRQLVMAARISGWVAVKDEGVEIVLRVQPRTFDAQQLAKAFDPHVHRHDLKLHEPLSAR
jgi:hypothetical protein